jgi:hypothetical protein
MLHTDSLLAFEKIVFSEQLQLLTAGQGHDWPDTRILQHNNFKVFSIANFRALFDMLDKKKFDYFPRSVAEITDELNLLNNKNLMVQPNILLYYPSPIYFFVCQEKKQLAERITEGLEQAIEDGSFAQVFKSSREYKAFLALGGLNNKRIFNLENSELNLSSLPKVQEYWLIPPPS